MAPPSLGGLDPGHRVRSVSRLEKTIQYSSVALEVPDYRSGLIYFSKTKYVKTNITQSHCTKYFHTISKGMFSSYVPKYTGSICTESTLSNLTGVFGTAATAYRILR